MDVVPCERCDAFYMIPTRVICLLLVTVQGGVIDYYLVLHNNRYWYAWIAGDVAMIFVYLMAFVISYRHLHLVRSASTKEQPVQTGSLPLAYFAWFVYSCLLVVRVAIIFRNFAWKLEEEDFFGPNTLKVNLSLSAVVYLLLLLSHHDAPPHSNRKRQIDLLTQTVVFDILDSVDILDALFDKNAVDALLPGLDWGIICVACANFILPTLPLMTLSRNHFGYKPLPEHLETLHKLCLLFLINAPLLSIRLVLWHRLDQDVSSFTMKNFIVICVVIYDFYEKGRFKQKHPDEADGGKLEMQLMMKGEDVNFNRSYHS